MHNVILALERRVIMDGILFIRSPLNHQTTLSLSQNNTATFLDGLQHLVILSVSVICWQLFIYIINILSFFIHLPALMLLPLAASAGM